MAKENLHLTEQHPTLSLEYPYFCHHHFLTCSLIFSFPFSKADCEFLGSFDTLFFLVAFRFKNSSFNLFSTYNIHSLATEYYKSGWQFMYYISISVTEKTSSYSLHLFPTISRWVHLASEV